MPSRELKPMILYGNGASPNPWKVALVLNALNISYETETVEFSEIKKEPFVKLNPNGRLPALVDPNKDITLWEASRDLNASGAIIDYLIDVYDTEGTISYKSFPENHISRCWEHFQMSGQGPYFGQRVFFEIYHPEVVPSVIERFATEIKRVIGVVDAYLEKQRTEYLVGSKLTYVDLMFVPWFKLIEQVATEIDTSEWKHYTAWLDRVCTQPTVAPTLKDWAVEMDKLRASRGY